MDANMRIRIAYVTITLK